MTQYPADTRAMLTASRVALANDIAAAFNVTRAQIKLPRDYAVMFRADGVRLAAWADEQSERVGPGAYLRPSRAILANVERMTGVVL